MIAVAVKDWIKHYKVNITIISIEDDKKGLDLWLLNQ